MADVLGFSRQQSTASKSHNRSDKNSCQRQSGLRRSHPSAPSLYNLHSDLAGRERNTISSSHSQDDHSVQTSYQPWPPSPTESSTVSSSSPPPSTIDLSDAASIMSTPASSGLSSKSSSTDDIDFPIYDRVQFFHSDLEFDHSSSSVDGTVENVEGVDEEDSTALSTTTDTTRSDSPLPTPTVADDTAVKQEPSRHVDYLSHDWKEEDIWSSWRHIVSQRKVYGQRSRLENASWRTWAKTKNHLATVSPETLNWLKESDVTWLYGPLKSATSHPITQDGSEPQSRLSKSNSFVAKKPILKKRSMSEVMLQKSLSTTSLVKQAAAAVQAQQGGQQRKSLLYRRASDFPRSTYPSEVPSRDQVDYFTSMSRQSSTSQTPCECQEKKHIRFDETVEQCIAVECKDVDFEGDDDQESDSDDDSMSNQSDSSSDDGVIMMKRKKRTTRLAGKGRPRSKRNESQNDRKMVETLPTTTLKNRIDEAEPAPGAQHHHTFGRTWMGSRLSPSPSQETLRPSHPSRNFLVGDEDEEEDLSSSTWSFGVSNPKSSLGASSGVDASNSRGRDSGFAPARPRSSTHARSTSRDGNIPDGMRRTPSGMFMPYDEDEDEAMAVGLFGRVSETINTARDIAHVIWNVGWRK